MIFNKTSIKNIFYNKFDSKNIEYTNSVPKDKETIKTVSGNEYSRSTDVEKTKTEDPLMAGGCVIPKLEKDSDIKGQWYSYVTKSQHLQHSYFWDVVEEYEPKMTNMPMYSITNEENKMFSSAKELQDSWYYSPTDKYFYKGNNTIMFVSETDMSLISEFSKSFVGKKVFWKPEISQYFNLMIPHAYKSEKPLLSDFFEFYLKQDSDMDVAMLKFFMKKLYKKKWNGKKWVKDLD